MGTFFSIELIAGVLTGLVIATVIMLVLQVRNSLQINKLTFPAYEYVVKQAEHKANEIIASAQKEARAITTGAEQVGQKTIAQYTAQATKIQDQYAEHLSKLATDLGAKLSGVAETGTGQFETLLARVTSVLNEREQKLTAQFGASLGSVEKLAQTLQEKTTTALSQMEKDVAKVQEELVTRLMKQEGEQEARIAQQIRTAHEEALAEIEKYQRARMALLDTHIEKLVEDITARVLHKQLTITDHARLAREALAEAKKHSLL